MITSKFTRINLSFNLNCKCHLGVMWASTTIYFTTTKAGFNQNKWDIFIFKFHVILNQTEYLNKPQLTVSPSEVFPRSLHHSGYGLVQWEEPLQCNAFSHWLSPHPLWTLVLKCSQVFPIANTCKCKAISPQTSNVWKPLHIHWLNEVSMRFLD